jgi:hypothetical protein
LVLGDDAAVVLDVDADDGAGFGNGPVDGLVGIVPGRGTGILVGFDGCGAAFESGEGLVGREGYGGVEDGIFGFEFGD